MNTIFSWFNKYLFLAGCCLALSFKGTAQTTDTLTAAEVKAFNDRAEEMYYSLENKILQILTPGIEERDLKIAIKGAKKMFSATARIQDKLGLDTEAKFYDSYRYFEILRDQFRSFYDAKKKWELKSKPYFKDTKLTGVYPDSSGNLIQYPIYRAEIHLVESSILTNKEEKTVTGNQPPKDNRHYNLNYKQNKAIEIHLRKYSDHQWRILIHGIEVIPDTLPKEPGETSVITSAAGAWLDSVAIAPGENRLIPMPEVPIVQPAGVRDTISVATVPPIPIIHQAYKPVGLHHYLVPGLGHHHFGRKEDRVRSYLYFVPAVAAFGASVAFKLESDWRYKKHLKATTLRELDKNYAKANRAHQRFLATLGIGALIWLGSDVHLFLKDKKQRALEESRTTLSLLPYYEPRDDNYLGLTAKINF